MRRWLSGLAVASLVLCSTSIALAGVMLPGDPEGYSFHEWDRHGNDGTGQINPGVTMATYQGTGVQKQLIWNDLLQKYEIWLGGEHVGYWEFSGPPYSFTVQNTDGSSTGGYGTATAN